MSTLLSDSNMMKSVALNETNYPESEEYVFVEVCDDADPFNRSLLLEDEFDVQDEYDFCDDVNEEKSTQIQQFEQSISFDNFSNQLFSFGTETDQYFKKMPERNEIVAHDSDSILLSSDISAPDILARWDTRVSLADVDLTVLPPNLDQTVNTHGIFGPDHFLENNSNEITDRQPPVQYGGIKTSRLTNKKRRKQLKLARKATIAAATAAAATSMVHCDTMKNQNVISGTGTNHHQYSHRKGTNISATATTSTAGSGKHK